MNKYEFTAYLVRNLGIKVDTVLDVGCRDSVLRTYLSPAKYYGIDIDPSAKCDAIVDVSTATPFRTAQFDLLIALDVAEHIDKIYKALCEMLRIASCAIISLPNMYHLGMRWRFFRGRTLSDKYVLNKRNAEGKGYRHRWLFTSHEAEAFMKNVAEDNRFSVELYHYYPSTGVLSFLACFLPPSLSAEAMYFVFRK